MEDVGKKMAIEILKERIAFVTKIINEILNNIRRNLEKLTVKQLIESSYFKVYKKQLGIDDDQGVVDLILSCANSQRREEFGNL